MKFFIAFALIAAVASASVVRPTQVSSEVAEIIAAIQSPSTDPATAAALEAMLLDVLGVAPAPISVGPAIVESNPISVGPAIVDFPLPDGGVVTAPVIVPSPAIVAPVTPVATDSSPLVQIIVNIKDSAAEVSPIAVGPAIVDQVAEEVYVPGPVNVVDHVVAPVDPIQVVNPIVVDPIQVVQPVVPEPIQVVEPIIPGPVNVVDNVVVEPVVVGTPIIVAPAVVLPEELN